MSHFDILWRMMDILPKTMDVKGKEYIATSRDLEEQLDATAEG